MKQTMRSIRFNEKSRADILHIEIPGAIVNIQCGLRDHDEHKITSVAISRDWASEENWRRWMFMDSPASEGMNVRIGLVPIQLFDKCQSVAKAGDLEKALVDAIQRVAEAAREMVDDLEGGTRGGHYRVAEGDIHSIREALKGWTEAGEALLKAAR